MKADGHKTTNGEKYSRCLDQDSRDVYIYDSLVRYVTLTLCGGVGVRYEIPV